jgi:hypothetical protein
MGAASRERVLELFRVEQMGAGVTALFEEARRIHHEEPRPVPSRGLALATATEAVEILRLRQELAGQSPYAVHLGDSARDGAANLRLVLLLVLHRRLGRAYRWAVSHGFRWLVPAKNVLVRTLLRP